MTLQRDVEILKNIKLFSNIEPAKLKLLAFTSEHLEFSKGDLICKEGEPGDAAYIMLDGEADVLVNTEHGMLRVAKVARNDVVGEIAILCDVPRTATVSATTSVVTLRISKDGFFNLVTQFPNVGLEIMKELAKRLNDTTQQVTRLNARLQASSQGSTA
jgi:CRP-like cAMP-binding protein